MSKTVVSTTLLRILKYAVSLSGFFEPLFSACVVRVLIRVILHSETPVGTLNLLL
jgi:hypothetical protein